MLLLRSGRIPAWGGRVSYENGYRRPSERLRRETPGRQQRSAYHSIVGDSPEVKRGDVAVAVLHLVRIRRAIDVGGWTRSEWRRLRSLEAKWALRAAGKDIRYNLVGTSKCGLTAEQRRLVSEVQNFKFTPKSETDKKGKANNGDRQERPEIQWVD